MKHSRELVVYKLDVADVAERLHSPRLLPGRDSSGPGEGKNTSNASNARLPFETAFALNSRRDEME
jgi:hypothetical protein